TTPSSSCSATILLAQSFFLAGLRHLKPSIFAPRLFNWHTPPNRNTIHARLKEPPHDSPFRHFSLIGHLRPLPHLLRLGNGRFPPLPPAHRRPPGPQHQSPAKRRTALHGKARARVAH